MPNSSESPKGWNPRYVAYAEAHGRTPEAQLEADKRDGVGMASFMAWVSRQTWPDNAASKDGR